MPKNYRFIHGFPTETIYKQVVDFRFDVTLPKPEEATRDDDGFMPDASDVKIHRLYINNTAKTAEQVEELLGISDVHDLIFDTIMHGDLDPWNYFSPDPEDDLLF